MKTYYTKLFRIFFAIIFISLIFSCSNRKRVKVEIKSNEFPEITLLSSNSSIKLTSVDNSKGSIGLRFDNDIIWITEIIEIGSKGNIKTYKCPTKIGNVILTIQSKPEDAEIELRLENDNGILPSEWYINIEAGSEEYFTGLFERVIDGKQGKSWADGISTAMNLRGEKVEMKLKPTVSAYAPFYISSANYGMFVYGTWPGVYDFCKSDSNRVMISFEGPTFKFKFYTGTPAELVKKHTKETGPVFLPPRWAVGPWRWRDEHRNSPVYYDSTVKMAPFNTDIVEDVLMMEAFDIPHTAVWIDRPWAKGKRGFDDYEFDTARLPEIENMIKWLNSKNLEMMIWIGPFVMGDMAKYATDNNYYLKSKVWIDSSQVLMDFTNEEAVKWWQEKGPAKLARMGIKGFKLDRADGEKLTDSLNLYTSEGTTYRENYNDFPRQYVNATYDAVKPVLGDDFILFPRSQYTGSAKYGAMWAGDTRSKPEGLRSAIIAMLRCSVIGYPVWGSDIGGYSGPFDHEVTQRWLGLGCFSPIMEVGPTKDRGLWHCKTEPVYDTSLIATWRLYSKIRMKLMNYIHNLITEAHYTGMPVTRPLFLSYPEQKEAWNDWQTYLLGEDILISVVWEKGITQHTLYLPEGETWIDAWDINKEYKGGQYVTVEAPSYKTPVFIKKNSGIVLGDLNALWQESLEIASKVPDLTELEKKEGWR